MNAVKINDPMHPGEFLKFAYLDPLSITSAELAKSLGISSSCLSRLINNKSALTAEVAIRLELVLGRSAESWMNLQMAYELKQARKSTDVGSLVKIFTPSGEQK